MNNLKYSNYTKNGSKASPSPQSPSRLSDSLPSSQPSHPSPQATPDKGHNGPKKQHKVVTVGTDWCGYTRKQVDLLKTHCAQEDSKIGYEYIQPEKLTDPEVAKSLRAFPTSFCCNVDEDSVECAIQQHKKGKSHVGMRAAKDLEHICSSE